MDNVLKIFKQHDPITIVELIIAIFGVVGSILVMTLSFSSFGVEPTPTSGAAAAITSFAGVFAFGFLSFWYSVVNIYGILRHKLKVRSAALFAQVLMRIYTIIALFLVQGFFPITWLSPLSVLFIVCVCYLTVRRKIHFYRGIRT